MSGFEKEGDALARTLGAGYAVEPYPDPAPEGAANADCIVTRDLHDYRNADLPVLGPDSFIASLEA